MKTVSLQDLKRHLSALVTEAAKGETILITKHDKPIARLDAAGSQYLHVGDLVGTGGIKRLLRNATKGRYLDILLDDRRGDPDGR